MFTKWVLSLGTSGAFSTEFLEKLFQNLDMKWQRCDNCVNFSVNITGLHFSVMELRSAIKLSVVCWVAQNPIFFKFKEWSCRCSTWFSHFNVASVFTIWRERGIMILTNEYAFWWVNFVVRINNMWSTITYRVEVLSNWKLTWALLVSNSFSSSDYWLICIQNGCCTTNTVPFHLTILKPVEWASIFFI